MPKVKEMKTKARQSGISLTEMTVVIAAVALLANLSMPAIRTFFESLTSRDTARAMISASLSAARAIAAKEQRYAGIRFQKAWHPQGPLYSPQYMIFIVQDTEIGAYFFRAVEGINPIKLPKGIGVMDFAIVTARNVTAPVNSTEIRLDDPALAPDQKNNWINESFELRDTTTFSIIFSPSGKMVIHGVRVRNRDGRTETNETANISRDDVFNTWSKIIDPNGAGMFVQDDYALDGLGPEPSRSSFVIYDRAEFDGVNVNSRWTDYLARLAPQMIYINSYTGRIID